MQTLKIVKSEYNEKKLRGKIAIFEKRAGGRLLLKNF
jgi:hypothetical protein